MEDAAKGKVRKMLLRCWARRACGVWLAECLELGLVADGSTPTKAIDVLNDAIGAYIENWADPSVSQGIIHRRVRFYSLKRLIWNGLFVLSTMSYRPPTRQQRGGEAQRQIGSITIFKETPLVPA